MLKVCDGPRLLVDLDGVIVFLYCPKFMGEGLQVCFIVAGSLTEYQPSR